MHESSRRRGAQFPEILKAHEALQHHCQAIYQKVIQVGRALASICYGGHMLLGEDVSAEQKKNVDFAMQYLS